MDSEVIMMKDATVSVRVENNIKNEAENILQSLGIPVSVLINSLYRQIIYQNGIPFSLKMPAEPISNSRRWAFLHPKNWHLPMMLPIPI